MRARRARPADAGAIYALMAPYVAAGTLLPRSEVEIRRSADHFFILADTARVVGCVALEPYGADLAEIRSLAVAPDECGKGLGAKLVHHALGSAKRRRIARVFAVTHAPEFFLRQGFAMTKRPAIPEKIERDCVTCAKARRCRLKAVVATVLPERAILPVIEEGPSPAPVQ